MYLLKGLILCTRKCNMRCFILRREKSLDAYRAEVSCMSRLRNEIIHLRALVSSQQDLINKLASDNNCLRREKFALRMHFKYLHKVMSP